MTDTNLHEIEDIGGLREEFRALRESIGASQRDVAKVLGLTQAAVSQFESGTSQQPRVATLKGIRQLIEVWRLAKESNIYSLERTRDESVFKCPNCLLIVGGPENGHHFCSKCGTPFDLDCAGCGHTNPGASRFCNHCARPLYNLADFPDPAMDRGAESGRAQLIADLIRFFDERGYPSSPNVGRNVP